ncbi:hypothetical protein CHARACLAT_019967 [Characodon lateralis]|uniref:Uncharacterized protein n=1 Tax=Characodon lateralis TaxID=208331 RepID=A0ABU7CQC6_9TELE|nr:hypothetical protein [Characodon lateralis]
MHSAFKISHNVYGTITSFSENSTLCSVLVLKSVVAVLGNEWRSRESLQIFDKIHVVPTIHTVTQSYIYVGWLVGKSAITKLFHVKKRSLSPAVIEWQAGYTLARSITRQH